eukprot:scaffold600228_cov41-Prasinocladus_malaysianus.AAC.3
MHYRVAGGEGYISGMPLQQGQSHLNILVLQGINRIENALYRVLMPSPVLDWNKDLVPRDHGLER